MFIFNAYTLNLILIELKQEEKRNDVPQLYSHSAEDRDINRSFGKTRDRYWFCFNYHKFSI